MADQCIICLEDLDVLESSGATSTAAAAAVAALQNANSTTHPGKLTTQPFIALIQACGHVLHDECLKLWSQKANSCPICRHAFNLVQVLDTVGGMFAPPSPQIVSSSCAHRLRMLLGFCGGVPGMDLEVQVIQIPSLSRKTLSR